MAERLSSSTTELETVMTWSGGHPLLVQALFRQMQADALTTSEAIDLLEDSRLPAFESWVSQLGRLIDGNDEIGDIVRIMLKGRPDRSFPLRVFSSRFAVAELMTKGWIAIDPGSRAAQGEDELEWRSALHRKLADEAYAKRTRRG